MRYREWGSGQPATSRYAASANPMRFLLVIDDCAAWPARAENRSRRLRSRPEPNRGAHFAGMQCSIYGRPINSAHRATLCEVLKQPVPEYLPM